MEPIEPLAAIKPKNNLLNKIKAALIRLAASLELVFVMFVWTLIFARKSDFGGMSIEQIAAYILVGNLIALLTSFMLEKIFTRDFCRYDSEFFVKKPFNYCRHLLAKSFTRYIFPFLVLAAVDIALLYLYIDSLQLDLSLKNIILIATMVVLAFFIEFLIAYLLYFFIFWTIESKEAYIFAVRFKKIISGAYFPLSILPLAFLQISLFLPFAYSFYVPAQLLLGNINFAQGLLGIYIQIFWLLALYSAIKIAWQIKKNQLKYKKNKR